MKTLLVSAFMLLAMLQVTAQKSEVFEKSGVAVNGYDVVAYFKESKPVKGDQKFTYNWKGANWQFSNQANLTSFKASPDKYAPQFGGYCAYGTSQGHKAPTKPDAWTIVDGKLYLNYNTDVKAMWSKDIPGFLEKANANWPKIKDKE